MEFEQNDRLQLQYLAGCNIVEYPPLFSPDGDHLFIRSNKMVHIYSTNTGELTRQLVGASSKLISMELELREQHILVSCSAAGEVLRWNLHTGQLEGTLDLLVKRGQVLTFDLLNFYGNSKTACAFVTWKNFNGLVDWFVVNTSTAERLKVPCSLKLLAADTLVAVDNKNFKNIAIAQGFYVYFLNYKTWQWRRLFNAYRVPVTVIRMHPTEELVATGDELGKIFLWRQFMSPKTVTTSLYHWHHTAVTSIAFSASGVSFYSSGLESVLVRWNINRPDLRNFIPRMCAIIRHIAVSDDNRLIAVATADNGVQFIGVGNELEKTLHEFTYIVDDKTGKSKFPIGLRLNPRTNTLVLNGRTGHLQFYSVYTRNLLYNMDIVMQNQLSMETGKILYNIRVTKAAFNIDWMATGEEFNDEEHLPELRLKFWKYQEESQSYTLNTNIELPHEGGFKAIEFSNDYQVDNLLCATVGNDNTIKMWSLEESDNIYKKGKVWYCIAQTNYKNFPIESISFSQDGSLLAAGCGNTLCVYKADNLHLKAALSSSAGHDGCVPKVQVRLAKKSMNGSNRIAEQRKKLMQLFTNLLDSNEKTLIKEIQKTLQLSKSKSSQQTSLPLATELDEKQKLQLYQKILQMQELNLFQKLLLYQKLGIHCQVHPHWQTKMAAYLSETIAPPALKQRTAKLQAQVSRINERDRFKAKYRLQHYTKRVRNYDAEITQHLVPIMSLLNLHEHCKQAPLMANGTSSDSEEHKQKQAPARRNATQSTSTAVHKQTPPTPPPIDLAQISCVQFAAGEYAHLVIVCTERRVLIWNLLTLRVQATLKLSVKHLAFDAHSNLIAALTNSNDLHVFQPNVPLPIYQRHNLPRLHGVTWLPRRHPKQRSINLDWQAHSTLYFLTEEQEIMFLGAPDNIDIDAPPPITFANAAQAKPRYTIFNTIASQQYTDVQNYKQPIGALIMSDSAKSAVQSLIGMSTHSMPPMSLLCADFAKSLVKTAESSRNASKKSEKAEKTKAPKPPKYKRSKGTILNGIDISKILLNGYSMQTDSESGSEDEQSSDEDEVREASNTAEELVDATNTSQQTDDAIVLKTRKTILAKSEQYSENMWKNNNANIDEAQLQRIAAQNIDFEL